ncbi:SDR family oxidoreductase [Aeromonas enteropelogenes]|uniref:SDR family NAD(P)-dependent oxidoreductase n=1 Tax=Aeromonas enteropelogenes TaxID=29489 RepID=UPI00191E6C0A|nr:SDR family oxidoreductase [Aeromonas enteropelogenes]MBL0455920.1 SDR family oxidoreductase [Aeromonas enteropelogenes]
MSKQNILITGGNGDLAKEVHRNMADLHCVYLPSRDELDVTCLVSVESYFKDKKFDVVINCAGTLYSSLVVDSEPSKWIEDINVNLIGTYLIARASLRSNRRARIINISSTAAFNSYRDWTSYCAAKAGVLKLSLGLTKDGYDVVTLCPGAIDTKLRDGLNIDNPNVMTISEGVAPIISAIYGEYNSGDVILYRKNELKIIKEFEAI